MSVSLNQEASSVVKNTLTATFSSIHLAIKTSPYQSLPMEWPITNCLAIVL